MYVCVITVPTVHCDATSLLTVVFGCMNVKSVRKDFILVVISPNINLLTIMHCHLCVVFVGQSLRIDGAGDSMN